MIGELALLVLHLQGIYPLIFTAADVFFFFLALTRDPAGWILRLDPHWYRSYQDSVLSRTGMVEVIVVMNDRSTYDTFIWSFCYPNRLAEIHKCENKVSHASPSFLGSQ